MPQSETEYLNELVNAAELGAMKALESMGIIKPYLSIAEAGKIHGKAVVKRWIDEGLIKLIDDGPNSKKRIERVRLEAVAKVSNRAAYSK